MAAELEVQRYSLVVLSQDSEHAGIFDCHDLIIEQASEMYNIQ